MWNGGHQYVCFLCYEAWILLGCSLYESTLLYMLMFMKFSFRENPVRNVLLPTPVYIEESITAGLLFIFFSLPHLDECTCMYTICTFLLKYEILKILANHIVGSVCKLYANVDAILLCHIAPVYSTVHMIYIVNITRIVMIFLILRCRGCDCMPSSVRNYQLDLWQNTMYF